MNVGIVGSVCKVIERTPDGEFHWDGIVTQVTEAFIETMHKRNRFTHPQWDNYQRAYDETWTKHYFWPTGTTPNIIA